MIKDEYFVNIGLSVATRFTSSLNVGLTDEASISLSMSVFKTSKKRTAVKYFTNLE